MQLHDSWVEFVSEYRQFRLLIVRHCHNDLLALEMVCTSLDDELAIFVGKHASAEEKASDRMKRKIDSECGREMITRRFATVEPVFGNVRANKKMDRFTLRGEVKVDGQWKLYCMVQNIEKLAHNGYAQ